MLEIVTEELRKMLHNVAAVVGLNHPATLYASQLVDAHILVVQGRLCHASQVLPEEM